MPNSTEEKSKMPDSTSDDYPHRPASKVPPTVLAVASHRPHKSGPVTQTSEFGGKPTPRSSSFDSDVWNGGHHHSGSNSSYSDSPDMSYGNTCVGDFGLALNPSPKPYIPNSVLILNPKQQRLSGRGVNMVQANTLRTERSTKWSEGSGKVEKGQYSSWKNIQNRGLDWKTKIKNKKVRLSPNEVKFGQISSNKLVCGGDFKLGTMTLSPPKILEPHMIGFQNHGNTCYLNASLQALLGLPMFVTDAVNLNYAVHKNGSGEKVAWRLARHEDNEQQVKLVIPFLEVTRAREYGEVAKVTTNIDLLKTELEQVDKQFMGNNMQDANEFLCRLVDSMKENVNQLFQKLSPGLKNGEPLVTESDDGTDVKVDVPNLVNSNFLSEREETFECMKCNDKESNRHTDLHFYCTVARSPKSTSLDGEELPVKLEELVNNTFETDEVRERRCDKNNCGHNWAWTTNRLVRLPRVLVLHLKRYDYEQGERSRKISRPVTFPAKLNLTKYVADHVELPNFKVVERLCMREPATPAKPQPTLVTNSRKRPRVESDDDNNLSSPFNNIEDQNLAAAIKASLNDTPAKRTLDMENHKIFSDSPTTAAANKFDNMDVSGDDTVKILAPKTHTEEERQIKEALKMSLEQDKIDYADQSDLQKDSNNNVDHVVGLPEHDYRLVSVVSHYGTSTNSGHYVADVYRFDQGAWFRYNDSVVTPIMENSVRNNTKNGYIFMYVQEALAQKYDRNKKSKF